ncbi:RNA polymerase ii-associated protein [Anaeramoeba flamelloides]|uniref:RNA polymerase II-associated protein 3 n=1 Tax=Anaeramoeba flamelloides TaxID=1746091 RepID=A0ABQ8XVU5_9EUKA|nr:RNA polymerase ii-associated protein [Anaeramoeba flamelloides]
MTSKPFARFEKWLDLMKKKDLEATQKKKKQRTNIPPIRKNNDKFNLKKQSNTKKTEKKQKNVKSNKQKIENFTEPTVEEIISTSSEEEEIPVKKEPEKNKRISSYDYDGWDKLIYEEKKKKKLIDEALEHKAKGNKSYGSKKWKEAITHYTKAISIYDGDHIFYSNRAACYLKIKMYKSAEEDCTRALQIDPKFIKAWFRRGLARKNLKNYRFAIKDFKKVLKLQPENQAPVKEILAINKLIKQDNPLNSNPKTNSSKQTKEKAKPNPQKSVKTNHSNSKKIENERKQLENIQEQLLGLNITPLKQIDPKQANKPQIQVIDNNENEDQNVKQNKKKKEKSSSLKTENKIINEKEIKKVTTNKTIEQNYNNKNTNDQQTTANTTTTATKIKTIPNKKNDNKTDKENPKKQQTSKVAQLKPIEVSIPSTSPKTFFEFEKIWRQFSQIQNEETKLDSKNKYLEIINPQLLPKIFQNSFSVEYFVEILEILQYRFKMNQSPNDSMKSNINKILYYISQIPRFSMAFMFLSRKEKQILTEIIGKTNIQKNDLYLKVRKLYKM